MVIFARMNVELGPGVADLLWRLGEAAITVEMTIDFEHDVTKHVAGSGPAASSWGGWDGRCRPRSTTHDGAYLDPLRSI